MDDCFPADLTELLQFLLDLVVAFLVIRADVIARFALRAGPGAELAFSSRHKKFC